MTSLEVKQQYEIPGIGGQRGYVSFGKESAKGKKEGDLKEFWHFGQYIDNNPKLKNEYPDNVYVSELPEFNEVGKKAYKMLEKTAKYVLRSLALYLGLEETYFDRYINQGNSILRPIHYPPIKKEPKNAVVQQLMETSILLRYSWEPMGKAYRFKIVKENGLMP